MQPRPIPAELIAHERALLAAAIRADLVAKGPKRRRRVRKLSEHVERTWVSAGCFGESVQWRLAKPRELPSPTGEPGEQPGEGEA